MKKTTIIIAICLVVLVSTVGIVSAVSGNSLTRILDKAGETLGTLLHGDMAGQVVISVNEEGNIGAASSAGITQSTSKIAQIALDITTTTPASLLNNSGQDRVLTRMKVWYESSQSTVNSALTPGGSTGIGEAEITFDVTTSSDKYVVNSTILFADNQAFPTSTGANVLTPQLTNATSPTGITSAVARLWLDGEYLNMRLTATPTQSTSTGWFLVEYVVR